MTNQERIFENPPIVESIVEIRFSTSVRPESVFGVFYGCLQDKYGQILPLPAANIPKDFLKHNPTLEFAPHYQLSSNDKDLMMMIGPRVIIFKYQKYGQKAIKYPGWNTKIYPAILEAMNRIVNSKHIDSINKVSLRSIDFFELDIISKLTVQITSTKLHIAPEMFLGFNFNQDKFTNRIAISNNSSLNKDGTQLPGSSIDIETSIEENIVSNICDYIKGILDQGHSINKNLFFDLLEPKYLDELKVKNND